MRFARFGVSRRAASDYDQRVMLLSLPPKLTVAAAPSAPIPNADPRPLFWVTGVVLGLLALWVLYVLFMGETRKAPSPPKSAPDLGSDGAE